MSRGAKREDVFVLITSCFEVQRSFAKFNSIAQTSHGIQPAITGGFFACFDPMSVIDIRVRKNSDAKHGRHEYHASSPPSCVSQPA